MNCKANDLITSVFCGARKCKGKQPTETYRDNQTNVNEFNQPIVQSKTEESVQRKGISSLNDLDNYREKGTGRTPIPSLTGLHASVSNLKADSSHHQLNSLVGTIKLKEQTSLHISDSDLDNFARSSAIRSKQKQRPIDNINLDDFIISTSEFDSRANKTEVDVSGIKTEFHSRTTKTEADSRTTKTEIDSRTIKTEIDGRVIKREFDSRATRDSSAIETLQPPPLPPPRTGLASLTNYRAIMTESTILGALRSVRSPIVNYQESRGVSKTEQISFINLVTSLCTHAYTAAITILVMLWNLAPLLDGFVYFARFAIDKMIDIFETEDRKEQAMKIAVFAAEIIIILFLIFLIVGLIFMPVYVLTARIICKVWGMIAW